MCAEHYTERITTNLVSINPYVNHNILLSFTYTWKYEAWDNFKYVLRNTDECWTYISWEMYAQIIHQFGNVCTVQQFLHYPKILKIYRKSVLKVRVLFFCTIFMHKTFALTDTVGYIQDTQRNTCTSSHRVSITSVQFYQNWNTSERLVQMASIKYYETQFSSSGVNISLKSQRTSIWSYTTFPEF
jgi:hypothetical protein